LKEKRTAIIIIIEIIKILIEERDVLAIIINILNQEVGELKKIIIYFINLSFSSYLSAARNDLNVLITFFQSYLTIFLIIIFSVPSSDKNFQKSDRLFFVIIDLFKVSNDFFKIFKSGKFKFKIREMLIKEIEI
jgi:hypothetical protein